MQIKEYILYYKLSPKKFADLVDVHRNTIDKIMNGKIKAIRYEVYDKIVKGTDGVVSLEDILKEMQGFPPIYHGKEKKE